MLTLYHGWTSVCSIKARLALAPPRQSRGNSLLGLVMLVRMHLLGNFARRQAAFSEPGAGALGSTLD